MAKSKAEFSIKSYGIYDLWQGNSKTLPQVQKMTCLIPAQIDIEFGFTLQAKKAKGMTLAWCIEHPNITDKKGQPMAAFAGDVYVRNNDWLFYLGDTLWAPLEDKIGFWHMRLCHEDNIVAEKTFEITMDCLENQAEQLFWKRRGF